MLEHEFQEGDEVSPVTELQGVTWPTTVVGVVSKVGGSGQITTLINHADLREHLTGSADDFPQDHKHLITVYHTKIRLVRRPQKSAVA